MVLRCSKLWSIKVKHVPTLVVKCGEMRGARFRSSRPHPRQKMFKEMDKDNDGTIDVKEFLSGLQQLKLKGTSNFNLQIRF